MTRRIARGDLASEPFTAEAEFMRAILPALLLLTFPLFLVGNDFPGQPAGEEIHYIKAARAWIESGADPNLEHPPLGKLIIASGIILFGDEPAGWRFFSAVAAALIVFGMFLWSQAIFENSETAWWTAVLTLLNPMLWTEARLATLEIFHTAFLVLACAAISRLWFANRGRNEVLLLITAGTLFGLALASKWFALIAWLPCMALTIMLAIHKRRAKAVFVHPAVVAAALVLVPLSVYALTYTPYLLHQGFGRWIGLQGAMWIDQTDAAVAASANPIPWYRWPLQLQPVHVANQLDLTEKTMRYLGLIANPVIVIAGCAAILRFRSGRERRWAACAFPLLFFFSWSVIPHKHQHYYYFFPAAVALALPTAAAFSGKTRWVVVALAALVFAYYFPAATALQTAVSVSF